MLYLLDSQYTYMHIFALTLIYQYKRKAELPLFIFDWKPANQKSLIALEKAKNPSLSGLSPHHHTTTFLFDTRAPSLRLQSIAHLL